MAAYNPILFKSFRFAVEITKFTEQLNDEKKYNLSRQVFRSGTSIGANVREAQSPESTADFTHKMKVAAKEAEETMFWLQIMSEVYTYPQTDLLICDLSEIQRLLTAIIYSSRRKGAR